jgi:hypothetical protein
MADQRGLVIVAGVTRQIADTNRLISPAGIMGAGSVDFGVQAPVGQVIRLLSNTVLPSGIELALDGVISTDATFKKGSVKTISAEDETSGSSGTEIIYTAGKGGPANGFAAGIGGIAWLRGGVGGAGSATKVAAKGGDTYVTAGNAGADGGFGGAGGGDTHINAGSKTGAGVAGKVQIGDNSLSTAAIEVCNATSNPTFTQLGTGTATFNGLVRASNASGLQTNVIDRQTAGTLSIGPTTATKVEIGKSGQLTEILGDLKVDGTENVVGTTTFDDDATFKGKVTFGDATTDEVDFISHVISDIIFAPGAVRHINPDVEAAGASGTELIVAGGKGAPANGAAAGIGGVMWVAGGGGGSGSATKVAADGGDTYITAGNAGADGGAGGANGGNTQINAGSKSGTGTPGKVQIGNNSLSTSAIEVCNATSNPTFAQLGTGQVTFNGNVDALAGLDVTGVFTHAMSVGSARFLVREGVNPFIQVDTTVGSKTIIFGNAVDNPTFSFLGSGLLSVAGPVALCTDTTSTVEFQGYCGSAAFTDMLWEGANSHYIYADTAAAGQMGASMYFQAGQGGAVTGLLVGKGGAANINAGNGAAGSGAIVSGAGGDAVVRAGSSGATGGAGRGLGGNVYINAGQGDTFNGTVYIGTLTTSLVRIGTVGSTPDFDFAGEDFAVAGTGNFSVTTATAKVAQFVLPVNNALGVFTIRDDATPVANSIFRIDTTTGAMLARFDVNVLMPAKNLGAAASEIGKIYSGDSMRFGNLASKPDGTGTANKGWIYTKNVSAITEFFYEDSNGSEVQITSNGVVNAGTSTESTQVVMSKVAIANIAAGAPVCLQMSFGSKIREADANGASPLPNAVGLAKAAITTGNSGKVVLSGVVAVPDAQWDTVPVTTDVGSPVYLSENVGKLTLSAPTTIGSTVKVMGWVETGGTGAVQVLVQPLQPFVL